MEMPGSGFEDFTRYVIGTNSSSEWTNMQMRGDKYAKLLKQSLKGEASKVLGHAEALQKMISLTQTYP